MGQETQWSLAPSENVRSMVVLWLQGITRVCTSSSCMLLPQQNPQPESGGWYMGREVLRQG